MSPRRIGVLVETGLVTLMARMPAPQAVRETASGGRRRGRVPFRAVFSPACRRGARIL